MRAHPPSSSHTTRLRLTATAGLAGLLLTACGGSPTEKAADDGRDGTPKDGGRLTVALASDFGCLDPQQAGSVDAVPPVRQLVDSLTDQDPATGRPAPWLAEKWEVSPDGTSFTFHLRPGATFSDGTPVDAAAVKANFDTAGKLGPSATQAATYLKNYRDTTVVDPLTAVVAFNQPAAGFLQATSTHTLGLVSIATTQRPAADRCASGVAGSGPFTLAEYRKNESIVLAKRTGYAWGSALWKNGGAAHLDRIAFRIVPETGVRTGSLRSGETDALTAVPLQDQDGLKKAGFTLQAKNAPGVPYGFSINNARAPMDDPAVRKAVSLAVNRKEVVDTVFGPLAKPATSPLASTTTGYTDLSNELAHAPDTAKQLLDGAGWTPGPDGIRTKDGKPLALTVQYFSGQASAKAALELLQQQLKAVGIGATLKEDPVGQGAAVIQAKQYDLLWGHNAGGDPDVLRPQYTSGGLNFNNLKPGKLDELLTRQSATTDPAQRAAVVAEIQRLIVAEQYSAPVAEFTVVLGLSPKVHDVTLNADGRLQLHDTWKS
ncbi:ABC transporter substrate-binding protein [Streptomyces sp. NPDC004126]|uniref:ABC transporter substrate-binding protein n=1 Tax=Streptomyces sp. NPDC004126 TaxID=3390695 RepID=UPI003D07D888